MTKHADIKHQRVIKTHSQIFGFLMALAHVVPVHPSHIEQTRDFIFTLAVERQRALSLDHPLVQELWELFDYLDAQEQHGINHAPADKDNEIAINFNHFEEVANTYRQRLPFTLSEIKKLLKSGREREFMRTASVRSSVSDSYNTGKSKEMRKPEFYHFWIFFKEM
ncbi:TPA: hypothetical protein ACY3IJ_002253 [Enterobacter asburiae]